MVLTGLGQIGTPVAGGVEGVIHFPHRRASDPGVGIIQGATLHVGQAAEVTVGVVFVQAACDDGRADDVGFVKAVGILVITVLVAIDRYLQECR